jgi:Domain of unknown function (DUF6285)
VGGGRARRGGSTVAEPHDAPSLEQMVESVREWIAGDVIAGTEGRLRFHARVAANMLGMIERELRVGPAQAEAHRRRLSQLGVADDAELAAAIRAGELDERGEELRELLRASVVDKLLVANPGYLDPADVPVDGAVGAERPTDTG